MMRPLMRRPATRLALLLTLVCQLAACTDPAMDSTAMTTITAEVLYRERMALPPGATLRVTMEDVSRMDATSVLIAEKTQDDLGAPPYRVSLSFDPALIDARHRYALRATIHAGDRLLFTSTEHVDALQPADSGLIRIILQRVPARSAAPTMALTGTQWTLTELDGEAVAADAAAQPPTLQLTAEDGRAGGFAGCNRYTGSYALTGEDGLQLGQMASTRKACPTGMALEQHFLTTLAAVRSWRIEEGRWLLLLDDQHRAVARFSGGQ